MDDGGFRAGAAAETLQYAITWLHKASDKGRGSVRIPHTDPETVNFAPTSSLRYFGPGKQLRELSPLYKDSFLGFVILYSVLWAEYKIA